MQNNSFFDFDIESHTQFWNQTWPIVYRKLSQSFVNHWRRVLFLTRATRNRTLPGGVILRAARGTTALQGPSAALPDKFIGNRTNLPLDSPISLAGDVPRESTRGRIELLREEGAVLTDFAC